MVEDIVSSDGTLEHFGVKGMRWGVRKDRRAASGPSEVTVRSKKGKGVVKTSGGAGQHASEDAVKRAATRQKGRASTVDSLSNAELKAFVERKKLEEQYMSYIAKEGVKKKSKGRQFIEDLIKKEISAGAKGQRGPTANAVVGLSTLAVSYGLLKGSGKHRGTMKIGAQTVGLMMGAGGGKHRAP